MVHSRFGIGKLLTWVAPVGLVLLAGPGQAWSGDPTPKREPTALDRLRADTESTGRVKEPGLGEAKIPEPTSLNRSHERRVLKAASAVVQTEPTAGEGFINESLLRSQMNQRRRELDSCRPAGSKAAIAPLQLRWTIVPGGHVKNTVVMTERQPTSLAVVKCVRKRMDTWVFASPAGGPIEVETSHTFAPVRATAAEKEMTAAKPKPAQGASLQQASTTAER